MSSSEELSPAAAAADPVAGEPSAPAPTSADPVPEPEAAEPVAPSAGPAEAPAATVPAADLSPERIAERVAVLDAADELPLAEHVELYQRLHAELQSALAEIDGP